MTVHCVGKFSAPPKTSNYNCVMKWTMDICYWWHHQEMHNGEHFNYSCLYVRPVSTRTVQPTKTAKFLILALLLSVSKSGTDMIRR